MSSTNAPATGGESENKHHPTSAPSQTTPRSSSSSSPAHSSSTFTLSFNLPDSRPSSPTSSIFSSSSHSSQSSMSNANVALQPPQPSLAHQTAAEAAERDYFSENEPPALLSVSTSRAEAFLFMHALAGRRVVLVTSGGTTVPLERQTVRFIDNFSAGTRGATSAEKFLEGGYAVIFLHRQFSLLPYERHFSHGSGCFLDFLEQGPNGNVVAKERYEQKMLAVLKKWSQVKKAERLLTLPFVTINDYLFTLREVAQLMRPFGPRGLLYLAAAVSDFFVPPERMVEHKIQSTSAADTVPRNQGNSMQIDGQGQPMQTPEEEETFDNFDSSPQVPRSKRLIVDLDPVPKFLKNLVDGWAPQCMIVSFKLETDPEILVHKAQYSLDRYQHHLVIGNLLATRKWEVVFVAPGVRDVWIRVPDSRLKKRKRTDGILPGAEFFDGSGRKDPTPIGPDASQEPLPEKPLDPRDLPSGDPEIEIESLIIPRLAALHGDHIKKAMAAGWENLMTKPDPDDPDGINDINDLRWMS